MMSQLIEDTCSNSALKSIKFEIKNLPPVRLHEWSTVPEQINIYLRKLLENHQQPNRISSLQLPSILDLAVFFHCCELDVFEALQVLKKQAYNYEVHGIDSPIFISDPLCRKPRNLKYQTIPKTMADPWQRIY